MLWHHSGSNLASRQPLPTALLTRPWTAKSQDTRYPCQSGEGTCMARAFPAWEPPLMMLKEGTGRTSFLLPARSARCLYRGTFFSAAPACSQWKSNGIFGTAQDVSLQGLQCPLQPPGDNRDSSHHKQRARS